MVLKEPREGNGSSALGVQMWQRGRTEDAGIRESPHREFCGEPTPTIISNFPRLMPAIRFNTVTKLITSDSEGKTDRWESHARGPWLFSAGI